MDTAIEFRKYSFAVDPVGEAIEEMGYDVDALMDEESPLLSLAEAWDDEEIRKRYPDALGKVSEEDGPIVLGRLTSLFGPVALEENEIPAMGFRALFLVYRVGDEDGEPVGLGVCYDQFAHSFFRCLSFDSSRASAEEVAREFWSLVLDELDELEDETVRVINHEDGLALTYGVADGEPFFTVADADTDELEEFEDEPYGQDRYDYEDEEEVEYED